MKKRLSDMYFEQYHRACQNGLPRDRLDQLYYQWQNRLKHEGLFSAMESAERETGKVISWNG